jgi:dephospho-CoA kinase
VRRVGLTGGIGSGKSTVAAFFAELGAVVLDADAVARSVLEPGTPGLAAVAAAFPGVVSDGALDREALAAVVFADPERRQQLEAITHPLIGQETARAAAALPAGTVCVHDVPLLVEAGLAPAYDVVVVVEAPLTVRLERLAHRGLSEAAARERIEHQASDEQRRAVADVLLTNAGDLAALRAAVRQVWPVVSGKELSEG